MHSPFLQIAEGGACAIDRAEVMRALSILMDPKQTFELRSLPSGRSKVCHGQDLPAAVEAAWEISDEKGLYFCLNPVWHDLIGAASNKDILSRRWLLIDVDTKRADKDSNATEAEKQAASIIVSALLDYLVGAHSWAHPLIIDSGNGWHLLVRIDLDNSKLAQQLVRDVLKTLAEKFDTADVKVDRAVHNAARISKLPGSWARKGEHSDERPHRLARLVHVPESIEIINVDQLKTLATRGATASTVNGHISPFLQTATGDKGLDSYVRSAIERECGRLCMTPPGNRDNQTNASAFSLGTMTNWPEMDRQKAVQALYAAARQTGLDEASINRAITSGWNAGILEPRPRPAQSILNGYHKTDSVDLTKRLIILASEVIPKRVEWLWENRIPLGKLTTFAGWGGLGKSFVTMDLAARISVGAPIPGMDGLCFEVGNCLILNTEDDPEDTSVPRLIEAGADLRRIGFARSEVLGQFNLGDLKVLDAMIDQLGGAKLLVIDPATAHLGDKDDHKNAELRGLLMPLSLWSMERSLAVILVTHVNKPSANKVEAMARVVGSVAWVNAVRAAVMFSKDPNDPSQRLFIPFKSNNSPEQKGLSYRIESTDTLARVNWIGEVDTTADEAINQTVTKTVGADAAAWMTDRFTEQVEWESGELRRLGLAAGHSFNALFKSKEVRELPIQKRPRTNANGNQTWTWTAIHGWPIISESTENPKVVVESNGTQ